MAATSWREWLGRLAIAARSVPVIAVLDEFPCGRLTPMVIPALNHAEIAGALPGRSATEVFDAHATRHGARCRGDEYREADASAVLGIRAGDLQSLISWP